MSSINLTNKLKNDKKNNFIGKNFDDFRNELLRYANANFKDKISDFSEASLGGMLLDFAAYVGESTSFYIDQQMAELDYELATNPNNIQKHLKRFGINNVSKTCSIVKVKFSFTLPIDTDVYSNEGDLVPRVELLPTIKENSVLTADSGISFTLSENVDFSLQDYEIESVLRDEDDIPQAIQISKHGVCYSGEIATDIFDLTSENQDNFISVTLENEDVVEVISVSDADNNEFYEVEFLTQDTIYKPIKTKESEYFQTEIASRRFVIEKNFLTNNTVLRFGNGEGQSLRSDVLLNPSDLSLPISGRNYMPRYSIDPKMLVKNNSFGISPAGKVISVRYRYGGGTDHNVPSDSINTVDNLITEYKNIHVLDASVVEVLKNNINNTISVINPEQAVGGSNGYTLEELKYLIPTFSKMQNRVINAEDLLARIYTMPTNFGKIYRASVEKNKFNNATKDLFIICKDGLGNLTYANDALKINLSNYLNELRVIGDEINIVDAPIFNVCVNLNVKIKNNFDIERVIGELYDNIVKFTNLRNMSIGESINVNDIMNIALNTSGVFNVATPIENIITLRTTKDNKYSEDMQTFIEYSNNNISIYDSIYDGVIYPPTGGIFELKYITDDIEIRNT